MSEQNVVRSESMRRIRRLSLIMQIVVVVGAVFAELGFAWVWMSPSIVEELVVSRLQIPLADVSLDGPTRALGFLISSLPLMVIFFALYQAFLLFAGYRKGEIFTSDASGRLRRIALAIIAAVLMSPVVQAALSVLLTAGAAPGRRHLVLQFSFNDYLVAALGGLLLAIALVMAEAVRIAKENREIV